ncbi:11360_t:CDS:2, partial [Acaulospora colombiana]
SMYQLSQTKGEHSPGYVLSTFLDDSVTRCGQACVFEKVAKPDQMDSSSLERLTEVENEIATVKNNQTVMQTTLNDILSELRRSNGRPADPPSATRPSLVSPRAATNGLSDHSSSSPPTPSNGSLPYLVEPSTASPVAIESYSKYSWTGFSLGGTSRPHRTTDAAHHVTFAFPRPVHHTSRRSGTMTPYRDSGVSSPANSDVDIPAHALVAPIEVINDLAEAPSEQGRPNKKRKRTESFGVGDYEPSQSIDQPGAGTSRRELD